MSGEDDIDSPWDPRFSFVPTPIDLDPRQTAPAADDVETTNPEVSPPREGRPSAPAIPLMSESYNTQLVGYTHPRLRDALNMPKVSGTSQLNALEPLHLPEEPRTTSATPSLMFEHLHETEDQFDHTSKNKPYNVMAIQSIVQDSQDGHADTKATTSNAVDSESLEDHSPQSINFADILEDEMFFEPSDHESHLGLELNLPFRVNSTLNPPAVHSTTEKYGEGASAEALLNEVFEDSQTPVTTDLMEVEKHRLEEKLAEAIKERNEAAREASELQKLREQPAESSQLHDQDGSIGNRAGASIDHTLDKKEAEDVTEKEPSPDICVTTQQKSAETSIVLTVPSSPVEDSTNIWDPNSTIEGIPPAFLYDNIVVKPGDVAPQTTKILASQTSFAPSERPHPGVPEKTTQLSQLVKKRKRPADAQNDNRKVSLSRTGVSLRGDDPRPRRFAGNGLFGPKPRKSRRRKPGDEEKVARRVG